MNIIFLFYYYYINAFLSHASNTHYAHLLTPIFQKQKTGNDQFICKSWDHEPELLCCRSMTFIDHCSWGTLLSSADLTHYSRCDLTLCILNDASGVYWTTRLVCTERRVWCVLNDASGVYWTTRLVCTERRVWCVLVCTERRVWCVLNDASGVYWTTRLVCTGVYWTTRLVCTERRVWTPHVNTSIEISCLLTSGKYTHWKIHFCFAFFPSKYFELNLL